MARSIYDIDLYALIFDRGVLREDRNTTFSFEIIRVHDSLLNFLALTEHASLCQHCIYERCFTMIDMCDDCNISDIFLFDRHKITASVFLLILCAFHRFFCECCTIFNFTIFYYECKYFTCISSQRFIY